MAFPKTEAIQCIPYFNGSIDELNAFIYHIDHFARKLEAGADHGELIYVELLKLKGRAAAAISRLKAWHEVKLNLIKEFGDNTPIEVLLRNIETLRQNPDKSFREYKNRTLDLKGKLEAYDGCESKVLNRHIRLHCIGGLKDSRLIQMAQGHQKLPLKELLKFLEEQYAECEGIAEIRQRLRILDLINGRRQKSR